MDAPETLTAALAADDFADSPEAIARGQRYLAWTAGAALTFVLAATVTIHVAREKHERAVYRSNQNAVMLAMGSGMSQPFPMP
jgi:hypothetical protein